ncbi:MAG: N-acetylmuramic acid 6-phosphate etherase [Candidatus Eremiobacteraeota bacterium]|nr:N-acetylmuramic acid 6-phosphate etherase [Candidatus Eremiobacteraeota bacterium]
MSEALHLPQTEAVNPKTAGLDELSSVELVRVLAQEQQSATDAVVAQAQRLAIAVDAISARLSAGGTLHYVGAGTSGRIGYLDASEMPPTFGTDPALVRGHIAGGTVALTRAVEGAEDDGNAGADEMRGNVRAGDAVVGVSASGGAAYVVRAIETARELGAWTLGVSNSDDSLLLRAADLAIWLSTGPEPLAGSTRLKAGTSQKILLNTLSTAVMVRLGKVYDNLMVDVVATNVKLRRRALRLVMRLSSVDELTAQTLLEAAAGNVKVAAVMGCKNVDAARAREILERCGGYLRKALS